MSESKDHIGAPCTCKPPWIIRLSVLHSDSLTPHLTISNQWVHDTPFIIFLIRFRRSNTHYLCERKHQTVMSAGDIELAQRNVDRTCGFALVASKINSDADKTTTIFRRFDELSARNLLFYQAELAGLEQQQKRQDKKDEDARDLASVECQSDWNKFAEAAKSTNVVNSREKEKMELAMIIRERLEKYRSSPKSKIRLRNEIN